MKSAYNWKKINIDLELELLKAELAKIKQDDIQQKFESYDYKSR